MALLSSQAVLGATLAEPPRRLCEHYQGIPQPEPYWQQGMVRIPEGEFSYGSTRFYDEERSVVQSRVSAFLIDAHPVTNAQFARFVEQTGYRTRAERGIDRQSDPSLPDTFRQPGGMVFRQAPSTGAPGWVFTLGASWRQPAGPGSDWQRIPNHPVVQVTLEDAQAYAAWAGRRLPTEAQLEYALRGGLKDADFSWGTRERPDGKLLGNTWQGPFPQRNAALDGFAGTSPVGCFPANGFGLFDAGGNVWEITRSGYQPYHDRYADALPDPEGPALVDSFDPAQPGIQVVVIKGGSHLCAPNACMRYRPSARQPQITYIATGHVGFRTVASVQGEQVTQHQ
ncbi:gliding motility-associated lipoprotein GldK [Pseudomonas oryzihabitans]|nr:gliding motility-associated lipoprotein GldK [Pseudomonas psychrotolerans]